MQAKAGKAWLCGHCSKAYPFNEHGKLFAEACCLCRECKKNPAAYMGMTSRCKSCHDAHELKEAQENLVHAQQRLKKAQIGLI